MLIQQVAQKTLRAFIELARCDVGASFTKFALHRDQSHMLLPMHLTFSALYITAKV